MTLGIMRRSLSNVMLVLATASLAGGLAHCAGGPDEPSQLNPQPLPPASGDDKNSDQGGGAPPETPVNAGAAGSSGGATSGSSGTSGVPGPQTGTNTPTDAGADADGG
jgi:hypothetical protein